METLLMRVIAVFLFIIAAAYAISQGHLLVAIGVTTLVAGLILTIYVIEKKEQNKNY